MATVESGILLERPMPYCPGCGHTVVNKQLDQVVRELGISPLDVIVVSDIGCCGLVDGVLGCHTVHGLHGRSTALAVGISLGLQNPSKKVIVVLGDGGATIGLQHILEAARQNVDMTVIVQDNMVYGMTGGQVSGLTPESLKQDRLPEEEQVPAFDLVQLAHTAGAVFSARVVVGAGVKEVLREAVETPGFSLVEIVEMCPSYGIRKVKELKEVMPYPEVVLRQTRPIRRVQFQQKASLLESITAIPVQFNHRLEQRLHVLIAGSAGEGIQSAGELLASAAMAAGLYSTKKGEYPITVGTGFSVAEVILSPTPIHYTGIETPDVAIVVSADGWNKIQSRLSASTRLIVDESLAVDKKQPMVRVDFRGAVGGRSAALAAIAFWLQQEEWFPLEALRLVSRNRKYAAALEAAIAKGQQLSPVG
ncbi:MAG: hypothetical protein GXO78_15430 [Calditrichaeota bacterium]|nr:hypothetical protein [Calditrichota bacterium]